MNLSFKIRTQKGLILNSMLNNPDRWFLCADFCGRDASLPFVGYKAPTRIAEMQKDGILESRWSEITTELGTKLKEYRVKEKHEVVKLLDTITVQEKLPF